MRGWGPILIALALLYHGAPLERVSRGEGREGQEPVRKLFQAWEGRQVHIKGSTGDNVACHGDVRQPYGIPKKVG